MEEELQQPINRFPEVSEESLNEIRERNVNKNRKKSTATWMSACMAVLGIFFIQLFPNWTACSPITYTNWIGLYFDVVFLMF